MKGRFHGSYLLTLYYKEIVDLYTESFLQAAVNYQSFRKK